MGVSFTLPLAWSRVGPRHNTHIFLRAENREEIFPRVCIAIATPSPSTPTRASETSVAIFIRRFSAAAAAPPFFSAKKWRFREPYPTDRVKYGPSSLQHEEKGRLKILPNMQSRDERGSLAHELPIWKRKRSNEWQPISVGGEGPSPSRLS